MNDNSSASAVTAADESTAAVTKRKPRRLPLDKSVDPRTGKTVDKRPSELAMELAMENRRTVEIAQDKIARDLTTRANALTKAREQVATRRAALDRAVALAVSSAPLREDWYDHPGALPRTRILEAASLNGVGLHRLMERYRKSQASSRRGRK